jgi:hypothetical protein
MIIEISQTIALSLSAGALVGGILTIGVRMGRNDTRYASKVDLNEAVKKIEEDRMSCKTICDHANKNLRTADEAVDVKAAHELEKHAIENTKMFDKMTTELSSKIDSLIHEQQNLKIQITRIETTLQKGI